MVQLEKNKMDIKEKTKELIVEALKNLGIEETDFVVEHPENFENGDYSTNAALVCAKKAGMNPKELAEKIVMQLRSGLKGAQRSDLFEIQIAGPGFINFYLSREFFADGVKKILEQKENFGKNKILAGQKVMVEYTQPNPFKPFHIGHLMSNAIGESISRIFEFSGAKTIHANYQGDVGPHVAKAIYGLLRFGLPDEKKSVSEKAHYIGELYVKGNNSYENNEEAKREIDAINKKIYDRSDEKINKIYDWGRKITLEAFEEIYKTLGTKFDRYYFESQVAPVGEKIVRKNIGKFFEESDGAVVFRGEKYDSKLHTRVFINSQGLPTYETKELGLTLTKFKRGLFEKKLDLSVVTTAVEQAEYMKVAQKAISLVRPDLKDRIKHITHGMLRFASGKMSSRKGNIITGESLLEDSMNVVLEKIKDREFTDAEKKKISEIVGVSALKYSILKSSIGSDIIYDFEKSISFEGDSGPYLQYTAVRANSILNKAKVFFKDSPLGPLKDCPLQTTNLEKLLYQFPEVVERSYREFAPHYIATYLTELASAFNSFYANTKILDKENKNMEYQLNLVKAFSQIMQNGLYLLGIQIPEKM
jgi:arginyl-tRNA synthetase